MKLRSQKFCTLQHLKAMLPFQLWTLLFFQASLVQCGRQSGLSLKLSLKYFSGSLFPALSQRISYAEPGCWQPFLHRGSRSSLRVCGAQSHPIGGSLLKARKKQHVLAGAPTIIIHQQLLGWLNVGTLPFDARGADLWDGFRRPGAGEICCIAVRSVPEWRGVPCDPNSDELEYLS